jgi:hypothetical protein
MDNIQQSAKTIKQMYEKLTYFDQYGGSVFMFIILLVVLFVVVSYVTVMRNFQPIKDDWVNQRCKPQVIPFAGLINKPDNMSIVDFTGQNFTNCMQNILIGITGDAVQPITYMTLAIREVFSAIAEVIQYIRTMLSSIRSNMTKIAQEVLGRIANIMVPIQQILISFKDAMNKVKGVLTAGLYTALGSYYALKAMLGAIVQMIIIILIILVALIIAMWIIPFTWPVAATMTAVFISISIPLAIIVGFMIDVLHVQTDFSIPSVPSRPRVCFDKDTTFKMADGTNKKILDIEVGDIFKNNVRVNAKMKLDAAGQTMYNLNGTVVSSQHQVKYNDKWIPVCEHPAGKEMARYSEPFLYCLNTSSKEIEISGNTYLDWDELDETNLHEILKYIPNIQNLEELHRCLDGGFSSSTQIKKMDGTFVNIMDVEAGDILDKNIKVVGVVDIDNSDLKQSYVYNLGNGRIFEGGYNLHICNKILDEKFYKNRAINQKTEDKLYHLITEQKIFYVNDVKFYDYDSNVELLLDKYRGKLLSMKYV